jgi:UDP-galactopyranose mutase|uniref:UDP-galactopyranose mutase C-terminal domain-containing protein n=1 Tax=viral metagenome TaxID=1070528 RepID=A0A6C0BHK8_9ZZZZ
MKPILIVGAGLSGCTIARQLAEKGYSIHIIEKRNHIGGNCYDYIDSNGIRINQYGAHIFHTNIERVWKFVNQYSEWTPWYHKVIGKIDTSLFPIPVNIDTVNQLCNESITSEEEMKQWLEEHTESYPQPANSEEVALNRVGKELYEKIFKQYTYKQWNKYPNELHPSVLERIPVRTTNDPHYFSDTYQALPTHGYTAFIQKMIDHPLITVTLDTEYEDSMREKYDSVFYTGPIDTYYQSYHYPKLEYRSIVFEIEELEIDQFQTNSVVNYPSDKEPYTRIVEYKHFLDQKVPGKTTIVKEYTVGEGDPYYPVPTDANKKIYEQYQQLAKEDEKKGIYFVGRLANYKYYNMDGAIDAALNVADHFLHHYSKISE